MSRSSEARTIYINDARPFREHTDVIRAKVASGEWKVVNAPRPINGELCFQGPCRHGIFYAAGDPATYENGFMGWNALDAWYVEEIDNEEIRRRVIARVVQEGFALEEVLQFQSIEELARGWGFPWRREGR